MLIVTLFKFLYRAFGCGAL